MPGLKLVGARITISGEKTSPSDTILELSPEQVKETIMNTRTLNMLPLFDENGIYPGNFELDRYLASAMHGFQYGRKPPSVCPDSVDFTGYMMLGRYATNYDIDTLAAKLIGRNYSIKRPKEYAVETQPVTALSEIVGYSVTLYPNSEFDIRLENEYPKTLKIEAKELERRLEAWKEVIGDRKIKVTACFPTFELPGIGALFFTVKEGRKPNEIEWALTLGSLV